MWTFFRVPRPRDNLVFYCEMELWHSVINMDAGLGFVSRNHLGETSMDSSLKQSRCSKRENALDAARCTRLLTRFELS